MAKDLTKIFEDKQFTDLRDMPNYPYVSDGKAIFYSGSDENWANAERYAKAQGMKPIQETRPGKIIHGLDHNQGLEKRFDKDKSKLIWDSASRKYAAAVQGEVKTFVAGASVDSAFRRVELPTILNNRQVTQINGLDRAKLDQMRRQQFGRLREQGVDRREAAAKSRESIYRKVALGEIRQDIKQARNSQDRNLEQDAQRRLQAVREQKRLEIQNRQNTAPGKAAQVSQKAASQNRATNTQERYKAIEERMYRVNKQKGLNSETARQAATEHVGVVKEKMALNNERSDLKSRGERLSVQDSRAYHARLESHRERRVSHFQEQAKRQGKAYEGPPARVAGQERLTNLKADEFAKRTRLEAAGAQGRFKPEEYQQRIAQLEKTFAERREGAAQTTNHERTPTRDHALDNRDVPQRQDTRSEPDRSTHSRNISPSQGHSL